MLLKQEDSMTYFVDEVVLPSVAMPPSAEWHVVRHVLLFLPDMVTPRCANALDLPYCLFGVRNLYIGAKRWSYSHISCMCAPANPPGAMIG